MIGSNKILKFGAGMTFTGLCWLYSCWLMSNEGSEYEAWGPLPTIGWRIFGNSLLFLMVIYLLFVQKKSLPKLLKTLFCFPGFLLPLLGLFLVFWGWGYGLWENDRWAEIALFGWGGTFIGWLFIQIGMVESEE